MPEAAHGKEGSLGQRVVTGVLAATGAMAALFLLPPHGFALAAALVFAGLGGREAARLAGLDSKWSHAAVTAGLLILCGLSWWVVPQVWLPYILALGTVTWLVNFAWLRYPIPAASPGRAGIGLRLLDLSVILMVAWFALTWLQAISPWFVVMLLVLIASADICAYFTGRAVGGARLAPRISPGKTRSGAFGGLAGAVVLTTLAAALLPASPFRPVLAAAVALVLALISIGGDLFISLLKRQAGLKDTSSLLPGHGGILDRFDSLSAAAPFFALAVMAWGE